MTAVTDMTQRPVIRASGRAAVLALGVLVAACAATAPRVLHFGMEDAPEGKRLMWPPAPAWPIS